MIKHQVTCGNCYGTGKTQIAVVDDSTVHDPIYGEVMQAHYEESICTQCNGKGYTEYVTFTVDEANVILKHCGLSTES